MNKIIKYAYLALALVTIANIECFSLANPKFSGFFNSVKAYGKSAAEAAKKSRIKFG